MAASLLLSSAVLLGLVLASVHAAGGFGYSLDDPYIHLALARSIQQGSYGINPGEFSTPSSSILWPFLLALAPARWMEYAPLAINAAACLLSVQVLLGLLRCTGWPNWVQAAGAVALGFGINLFGIAMTGMEHSLQVLLVLCVAWRLQAGRFDALFYLALGLAPLVRYECLVISLPAAAYVFATKERLKPALCMLASLGVMAAFSFWLHAHGLPWLPLSVLAKAADRSISLNLRLQPMLPVMLAWLGWVHFRDGRPWRYGMLLLAPAVVFLLVGRAGWFGRYEVFMAAWMLAFVLPTLPRHASQGWRGVAAAFVGCVALPLCFPHLWQCTLMTPRVARYIAEQHGTTARIVQSLGEPVAVNDLGVVAWRTGVPVLDLWGLGSPEALEARLHGPWDGAWIDAFMARRGVDLAFIDTSWFPALPAQWTEVAVLSPHLDLPAALRPRIALMARTPAAARRLRDGLQRMRAADPSLDRLLWIARTPA